MQKFDLELAKQGHPVCTRDGRPARIVDYNYEGSEPIVAIIKTMGGCESIETYTNDGRWNSKKHPNDLIMAPVKHEGWVNVFNDGKDNYTGNKIYATKEEAEEYGGRLRIATAKIEWEE
jgi:hypothetical protein